MINSNNSSQLNISVIIPAYNEAEGIYKVIEELHKVFVENKIEHEIIVVDDGSTDNTADEAGKADCKVIRKPTNKGYGHSLITGILAAKYELIAITDADSTYPAEILPEMIKQAQQYDMVVGRRTGRYYTGSIIKKISRFWFRMLTEFVTGTHIPDINSGLRIFRRSFILKHRPALSTGYSFTTSLTLLSLLEGLHLLYIPISYYKRAGTSKVKWTRDTLRSIQIITQIILLYNPLKLFLLFAFIPFLLFGIQTIAELIITKNNLPFAYVFLHIITEFISACKTALFILIAGCLTFVISYSHSRKRNDLNLN